MAKQPKVRVMLFKRPVKLSSLSARAAAMTPSKSGMISEFSCKYQAGIAMPAKVIKINTL